MTGSSGSLYGAASALGRSLFNDAEAAPLMNAAGTVKTLGHVRSLLRSPLPAIMMGSFTRDERLGNDGRTYFDADIATLNSMGLPGPSCGVWADWVSEAVAEAHDCGKELWVSVAGFGPPEYRELTELAFTYGADAVELNLGCPNVWHDGAQKPIVSLSPVQTALVLDEMAGLFATHRIGAKLSPILDVVAMSEVDRLLVEAGIAFISVTNTVPNCFAFAEDGRPAITFGSGLAGMSGPAIKYLAMGQVVAHRNFVGDLPVFGVGGVARGLDLYEFTSKSVGASACQVATAFWQRGPKVFVSILEEFAEIMTSTSHPDSTFAEIA